MCSCLACLSFILPWYTDHLHKLCCNTKLALIAFSFSGLGYAIAVAALGVVAFVLLVMLAVLVVLLCCCACQRYESVQHLMYRMHLRSMPPTNESPGSLLPHAQTHV